MKNDFEFVIITLFAKKSFSKVGWKIARSALGLKVAEPILDFGSKGLKQTRNIIL